MAYERMLFADAVCHLGAAVAANNFKALPIGAFSNYTLDELERLHQIQAYLKRCIHLGTLPARRWPLYGIEPAPIAPVVGGLMMIEDPGLMVSLADFRVWIETSKVAAPVIWADALSDSIQWDDQPIPGTRVITGKAKGRPLSKLGKLGDNVQAEANEIALRLYELNGEMPTQKTIAARLGTKYSVAWSTAKDRFKVNLCKEYIKQQKQ
ncbi:hypothetical protein [Thiomonas sp.]